MTATKRAASDAGAGDGATLPAMDPNVFAAAYGQTMVELQREFLVGMGQIQRDYLTFVGERMRKDVEIAKRMATCRDMKAAMELQSAFVETARDDYLEEAQKMLAMGRDLTEACMGRLAEAPTKADGAKANNQSAGTN
jgi:hypothetical protein